MEPAWHGLLTCDYEHTRPDATRLEWDLYTTSLITWPHTLMAEPSPYGRLRRPGIVDIPEQDHHRLLSHWHALLADPGYVADLAARTTGWTTALARALNTTTHTHPAGIRNDSQPGTPALPDATTCLVALNTTHIVNWLLPEQQWEHTLTGLFGDLHQARACLLGLMTPTAPGHLLDAYAHVLSAARQLRRGADASVVAAVLAGGTGPVYGAASPGRTALPLEDPTTARIVLARAAADDPDTDLATVTGAHADAHARRDTWLSAAILSAAGNPAAVRTVQTIASTCRWATDCEERRKEFRHRYLAAVRRWCANTGTDPDQVTLNDFLPGGAP